MERLWGEHKQVFLCALGGWTHQEGSRARNSGPSLPLRSTLSRESLTLHQGWDLLSDVHHRSKAVVHPLGMPSPSGGVAAALCFLLPSCMCSSWADLEMSLPRGQEDHASTARGKDGLSLYLWDSKPHPCQLSKRCIGVGGMQPQAAGELGPWAASSRWRLQIACISAPGSSCAYGEESLFLLLFLCPPPSDVELSPPRCLKVPVSTQCLAEAMAQGSLSTLLLHQPPPSS